MNVSRPYRFRISAFAVAGLLAALAACGTNDDASSIQDDRGGGTGLQTGGPPYSPVSGGAGGAQAPGAAAGSVLAPSENPLAPRGPQLRATERD